MVSYLSCIYIAMFSHAIIVSRRANGNRVGDRGNDPKVVVVDKKAINRAIQQEAVHREHHLCSSE